MKKKADILQMCIASSGWFSGFKNTYIFHYVKPFGEAVEQMKQLQSYFPIFISNAIMMACIRLLKKSIKK